MVKGKNREKYDAALFFAGRGSLTNSEKAGEGKEQTSKKNERGRKKEKNTKRCEKQRELWQCATSIPASHFEVTVMEIIVLQPDA